MNVPESAKSPDILVVGAGPTGLTTALLLAQAGWSVTVLERWPEPYAQPRAIHIDDEVYRILAGIDHIRDRLPVITEPVSTYEWRNASGQTLIEYDWRGPGPSGWPRASSINQPALEYELECAAAQFDNITVLRGFRAVSVSQTDEHIEVQAHDENDAQTTFLAVYVVGCDGANSTVRNFVPSPMHDLGFFFDWLIVDVIPRGEHEFERANLQICDPRRPSTVVSGGPGRRRWEFMRMPHETIDELNTEESAWKLLAPWNVTPDNGELERHAVYTFAARWSQQWRRGRALLAGDAAHLMPPFAGQGMCSGIRDAANLAFKLDLVLSGHAGADVLDTYVSERRDHIQHAINMSVELGKVICVTDSRAVAHRDAEMIKAGGDPAKALPPLPPAVLSDGLLFTAQSTSDADGAGTLFPQGNVSVDGRSGLFDDVVGTGFVLLSTIDLTATLSAPDLDFLDTLGVRCLRLVDAPENIGSANDLVDLDNVYRSHLTDNHGVAALARPDYYLFGVAATSAEIVAMVDDLRGQLSTDASVSAHRAAPQQVDA